MSGRRETERGFRRRASSDLVGTPQSGVDAATKRLVAAGQLEGLPQVALSKPER